MKCINCDNEIRRKWAKKFCSKECRINYTDNKKYSHICALCDNEFKTNSKVKKYCSDDCVLEAKKRTAKKHICKWCMRVFYLRECSRGSALIYCSRNCSYAHLKYNGWLTKNDKLNVKRFIPKSCKRCGNKIIKRKGYFCEKCFNDNRKKHDERSVKYYRERIDGYGICNECGIEFDPKKHRLKTICEKCLRARAKETKRRAKSLRRAKLKKAKIGVFATKNILKRDGYKCQNCGIKTRPDFNPNHDKYPNLDHIIPLAKGGEHASHNLQCLCRKCNLEKRDGSLNDQLLLKGIA